MAMPQKTYDIYSLMDIRLSFVYIDIRVYIIHKLVNVASKQKMKRKYKDLYKVTNNTLRTLVKENKLISLMRKSTLADFIFLDSFEIY